MGSWTTTRGDADATAAQTSLEGALRARIRADEARYTARERTTDALWDHVWRVAAIAEQLGEVVGEDPALCRLAALFHDAGKFSGGRYHGDDTPEEERSVAVLEEMADDHGLAAEAVAAVGDAIRSLYSDDPDPSRLGQILFDADNLDKLGLLGVANFFVKAGLRGRAVSPKLLQRLTVELTYARHAERSLWTAPGRALARRRAAQTTRFCHQLLDDLRDDGLADLRVETVTSEGLELDVVMPHRCDCGGRYDREITGRPGIKCSEIRLEHICRDCGRRLVLRFCRPRLGASGDG